MFRDPSGDDSHLKDNTGTENFNGIYRESYWTGAPDTTLLTNVISATGIDPRYSAAFGIFFVDKTEMAKCFKEFAIAHDRSTNSYRQSWIDVMDQSPYPGTNENKEFTFTVETESVTGDIYFMVDTYYYLTIPRNLGGCVGAACDCIGTGGATDPTQPGKSDGFLNTEIEVKAFSSYDGSINAGAGGYITSKKIYHDSYTVPVLLNNYQKGDWIEIKVKYQWNRGTTDATNYIPRDFTVSAYSKNDLKIYLNKTVTDTGNPASSDYPAVIGTSWDRYTSTDVLYQQKLYTDGKFAATIYEEFTNSDFV